MENYIFTMEDGILYKNGEKIENKIKISKVEYDFDNFISYCGNCGAIIDCGTDFYCNKCGYKLEYNDEKEKRLRQEYDSKVVHSYGWPLTEKDIVNSVGRPLYIMKHSGDYQWKVVNKIEINDNGYIIKFTDGSNHLLTDIIIYDPTNIVRNKLYSKIIKKEK